MWGSRSVICSGLVPRWLAVRLITTRAGPQEYPQDCAGRQGGPGGVIRGTAVSASPGGKWSPAMRSPTTGNPPKMQTPSTGESPGRSSSWGSARRPTSRDHRRQLRPRIQDPARHVHTTSIRRHDRLLTAPEPQRHSREERLTMTGNAAPIRRPGYRKAGPASGRDTLLLHPDSPSSRITELPTGVPQPGSPPS
jgi:hypothetical protein